jgi:hypothetical protein
MTAIPDYLERLYRTRNRAAVHAMNLGRTLAPGVGETVLFDPIGRVGKKVKKYAGDHCKVVGVQYETPTGVPSSSWVPTVYVEFADGFRYHLTPWHFVEPRFSTGAHAAAAAERCLPPAGPVSPADYDPPAFARWDRVQWLKTLVGSYRDLRRALDKADRTGVHADIDPGATAEMLSECEALAAELEAALPPVAPAPPRADDPTIPY